MKSRVDRSFLCTAEYDSGDQIREHRRGLTMLAPVAAVWSLVTALAFIGCGVPRPIESDPASAGREIDRTLDMPMDRLQSGKVPRIEPADCVTQALVDANADCYVFFGQENRDAPNGTIVELPVAIIAPETESDLPTRSEGVYKRA